MPRNIDILHGRLSTGIFAFAMPLAFTQILSQLFNAADLAVVGRLVGKHAMAAVGSNHSVIGIMVALFFGLSVGSNVIVANHLGAQRREAANQAIAASLWFAVGGGLLVAGLGCLFSRPLLHLLSVPEEVFEMALLYLRIYLCGAPIILLYTFAAAIFRARGDTRTPLYSLTTGGIINVIFNLIAVLKLGMTVDGVALATVLANGVSAAWLLLILFREPEIQLWQNLTRLPSWLCARKITVIGLPCGIQSMVFSLSNICIQSAINQLGADAMAASAAAFNLEILAFYFLNCYSQACTTFVGQNYGAGNLPRCKAILRTCLVQGFAVNLLIMGSLLLVARQALGLFNPSPEVIALGHIRLLCLLLGGPANVLMDVASAYLRGFGRSLPPAIITLVCVCGLRIIWVYLLFPRHQSFGFLMTCYPFSWLLTAIIISLEAWRYSRTIFQQAKNTP